jgi:hypothetical protein
MSEPIKTVQEITVQTHAGPMIGLAITNEKDTFLFEVISGGSTTILLDAEDWKKLKNAIEAVELLNDLHHD